MADRLPAAFSTAILLSLAFAILTAWIADPWPAYCLYAMVFAIGALWSFVSLWKPAPIGLNYWCCVPASIALWGIVQLAAGSTVNRWQTRNAVLLWATNAVLFFLATQLFTNAARRDRFLNCLLGLGLALAIAAVFQLYTADGKIFWHFKVTDSAYTSGPFPYHNHFAAFVVLILPIAICRSVRDSRIRVSYALIVGALTAAVFASASRSGAILILLEIVIGLISTFYRNAGSTYTRIAPILVVTFLVAVSVTVAGWNVLWVRFHAGDPIRLRLAESSLDMIRSAPWTGTGLGTWPSAYPMHARFDDGLFVNQAHSDWLQWAAEGGIPMSLALLSFAIAISIPSVRSIWAMGVPAVLMQSTLDYPLQKPAIAAVFFVIAGALAAQRSDPCRAHPSQK